MARKLDKPDHPRFPTLRAHRLGCARHDLPVQNVSVYHRRVQVAMAEQFLNRADIIAIFQQ
jgi:hypothetical protein